MRLPSYNARDTVSVKQQSSSASIQMVSLDATSESRRVPSDIVEIILDHNSDCKLVQKRCSLVCREWLPLARRHLFHTVRVSLANNDRSIVGLLALLDSSPSIRTSIRHFTLKYSPRFSSPSSRARASLDGLSLLLLLSELSRLQILSLQGIQLSRTEELRDAFLDRKFSLRSLTLRDITCSDAPRHGDVTNVLSLFSHVGYLVLESILPNFQTKCVSSLTTSAPYDVRVEGLELPGTRHGVGTTVWLSLLCPSLRFLTCISMFCHSFRDVTCFANILSQASGTLRSISLKLSDADGGGLSLDGLGAPHRADVSNALLAGMSTCSQVEVFELHGFVTVDKPQEDWTMLTSIISHVTTSLKNLTLRLYFEDTKWGDQVFHDTFSSGWELLRVLCGKFTGLQSFSFDGGNYDLHLADSNCKAICEAMGGYHDDEERFWPAYSCVSDDDPLQFQPFDLTERWTAHMSWAERR
ncbi:hypothetical protein BC835DRAFT_1411260 [Cytidiella melzeri]|nr:hypothetical protein BC835DRAFT_1411260 [Cytidiella melzeri]